METCDLLSQAVGGINWWRFTAATVVCIACGAMWYSVLFPRTWARVFKIDTEGVTSASMMRSFGLQILATVVYGFALWVLAALSVWIAIIALAGFCAWEKGNLSFDFSRTKDFFTAALIRVGYTFLAGMIFIIFALL